MIAEVDSFTASVEEAELALSDVLELLEQIEESAPKGPDSRVGRRCIGWTVTIELVRNEVRRLDGQLRSGMEAH